MTVIPRRNFKEWLQLYVNFLCVCGGGGGGRGEGEGGKVSVKRVNKRPGVGVGVGYCHIWAIWECATVKDMVFKQFTLRVWV